MPTGLIWNTKKYASFDPDHRLDLSNFLRQCMADCLGYETGSTTVMSPMVADEVNEDDMTIWIEWSEFGSAFAEEDLKSPEKVELIWERFFEKLKYLFNVNQVILAKYGVKTVGVWLRHIGVRGEYRQIVIGEG